MPCHPCHFSPSSIADAKLTDLSQWILEILWKSREVQKNWKPDTIIEIGRRFVQARYLHASKERRSEAIRLCGDICYNLRRVWGSLDPKTLEMSNLLSQLYTNMGHYREAQGVHENVLRLIVEGDDGDDSTQDTINSKDARHQVELLKQSYLRLRGWDKSPEIYRDLIEDLKRMPEFKDRPEWKDVRPVGEWDPKEPASETEGKFLPPSPKSWFLVRPEDFDGKGGIRETAAGKRPGAQVKRVTSNWGMSFGYDRVQGGHGGKDGVDGLNGVMNGPE